MRLVVSPHLDDAVFSCGAYLAGSRDPVLTIFGGSPFNGGALFNGLTDYDRDCGFTSSVEAMATRRAEDSDALASLGVAGYVYPFLDHQYATAQMMTEHIADIANAIEEVLDVTGADGLVAPLGLQHPDHVLVSDAALVIAATGTPVWLYEELPYRVVWPGLVPHRIEDVRALGWHVHPDFIGGGSIEAKEKAIACYASQTVDVHCCLCPERYWRVLG